MTGKVILIYKIVDAGRTIADAASNFDRPDSQKIAARSVDQPGHLIIIITITVVIIKFDF